VILLSNVFKLNEVVRHVHYMNPPGLKGNGGVIGSGFMMSGKKFKSLPPATQKMLMDLRNEYGIKYASELMQLEDTIKKQWADKNKMTFRYSSPADEQRILAAGTQANDSIFKKLEGDGAKNVRAVVTHYTNARNKYEAENAKKR